MPLLVDRYTVKGQSPAMADSPHLREISLTTAALAYYRSHSQTAFQELIV
jgi:hypothetical protein